MPVVPEPPVVVPVAPEDAMPLAVELVPPEDAVLLAVELVPPEDAVLLAVELVTLWVFVSVPPFSTVSCSATYPLMLSSFTL